MLELMVSRGSEELIAVPLDADSFRLGRSPANDLAIPDPTVSRYQCEIVRDGDTYRLNDRSGRGTCVNGKRYQQIQLAIGSQIDCGSLTVTLRDRPAEAMPASTVSVGSTDLMTTGASSTERLRLVGRVGGEPICVALVNPVFSIGSASANDLVIDDPFVSSFHCRLFCKQGAWFITDLKSTNGTRVNSLQVVEARLEPGASVQLGNAKLLVERDRDSALTPIHGFFGIVSVDPAMLPIFSLIERAAPTDETVLIVGDSGSGKELVAKALHKLSRRASRPMITLNCSAISRDLLESELFGHERGAFTGAQARRKGLFEEADGGTLFLDEIGELDLDLQAKLLRVLENGEIRPVGSNTAKRVDTRVLAATHRSLPKRVRSGEFREDLFYRINVIEIAVPPLRKRAGDIPVLADYFLKLATRHTQPRSLSPAALKRLSDYRFPGNVRELKNMITRAAILCPDEEIEPKYLTFAPPSLADRLAESQIYHKGRTLREVEIETIRRALEANDFNQKVAAEVLGIARSTLIHKLGKYGIQTDPQGKG